jgi:hypothetical protein
MALDKDVRDGRSEDHRAAATPAEAMRDGNEHELQGDAYDAWEAAWVEEIHRREKEWEAGQTKMCTLEEVRASIRALLSSR